LECGGPTPLWPDLAITHLTKKETRTVSFPHSANALSGLGEAAPSKFIAQLFLECGGPTPLWPDLAIAHLTKKETRTVSFPHSANALSGLGEAAPSKFIAQLFLECGGPTPLWPDLAIAHLKKKPHSKLSSCLYRLLGQQFF